MSQSDWTAMANGLSSANVAHGVSQAFTAPSGGGNFTYAWHALQTVTGVVGMTVVDGDFAPTASGVRISAAIQRNGNKFHSVMLCGGLDANDVSGDGYLLGFTHDEEPGHLVLHKGSPSNGLLATPTTNVQLRKSDDTYLQGEWAHLMLDVIVQPHGDVHLQVWENDLDSNDVTSPSWGAIGGMAEYIDDAAGVLSGSLPFSGGGYAGLGFYSQQVGRYALADHVKVARQL